MELKLLPSLSQLSVGGVSRASATPISVNSSHKTSSSGTVGANFSAALSQALASVSQAQDHAAMLQREVQLENPKVSLEQTMVAIQKAQIGFQATIHVRNRMVQAYTDIMNMQV